MAEPYDRLNPRAATLQIGRTPLWLCHLGAELKLGPKILNSDLVIFMEPRTQGSWS
jgi:hypothetical protein